MARRRRKKRPPQRAPKHNFILNDKIEAPEVRLVGDDLDKISQEIGNSIEPGVYKTRIALDWARAAERDLVEISGKASPPVVKIVDFNKFLYDRKKKEKEIKAKAVKTVIKEIRFGPNTDEHDFQFKLRHAVEFLQDGAKVKAYVHFRGRTIVFKDRGELLLLKFVKELEELGAPEYMPKMEGRRMHVIIAPKKVQKKPKKKKESTEG